MSESDNPYLNEFKAEEADLNAKLDRLESAKPKRKKKPAPAAEPAPESIPAPEATPEPTPAAEPVESPQAEVVERRQTPPLSEGTPASDQPPVDFGDENAPLPLIPPIEAPPAAPAERPTPDDSLAREVGDLSVSAAAADARITGLERRLRSLEEGTGRSSPAGTPAPAAEPVPEPAPAEESLDDSMPVPVHVRARPMTDSEASRSAEGAITVESAPSGAGVPPSGTSSAAGSAGTPPSAPPAAGGAAVPPAGAPPAAAGYFSGRPYRKIGCGVAAALVALALGGTAVYQTGNRGANGNGTAPVTTSTLPDAAAGIAPTSSGTAPAPAPVPAYLASIDSAIAAITSARGNNTELTAIVQGIESNRTLAAQDRLALAAYAIASTNQTVPHANELLFGTASPARRGLRLELDNIALQHLQSLAQQPDAIALRELRALSTLGYTVKRDGALVAVDLHGANDNPGAAQGQIGVFLFGNTPPVPRNIFVRPDTPLAGEVLRADMSQPGEIGYANNGRRIESQGMLRRGSTTAYEALTLSDTLAEETRRILKNEYRVETSGNTIAQFRARGDATNFYAQTSEGTVVALGTRNLLQEAHDNIAALTRASNARVNAYNAFNRNNTAANRDALKTAVLAELRADANQDLRAYVGFREAEGAQNDSRRASQPDSAFPGGNRRARRALGISSDAAYATRDDLVRALTADHISAERIAEALTERGSTVPAPTSRSDNARYERELESNFANLGYAINNEQFVLGGYLRSTDGNNVIRTLADIRPDLPQISRPFAVYLRVR